MLKPWIWVIVCFAAWMMFLDENHMRLQYQRYKALEALNDKRRFYIRQINQVEKQHNQLTGNPETQERFAREKYFMKRDGEDVFVIEKESTQ